MQVIKIVKDMFGNISDTTASRKISLVRDALDKQKPTKFSHHNLHS